MSQYSGVNDKSFTAGADLSTKQYYIVKMCTSTTPYGVDIAILATDKAIGVVQNEPHMSETAVVRIFGTTKVVAGTPIAINDWIVAGTDGRACNVQADKNVVIGIALETAAAAGDIIEMKICSFTASI